MVLLLWLVGVGVGAGVVGVSGIGKRWWWC